jgi:hypothetical protein
MKKARQKYDLYAHTTTHTHTHTHLLGLVVESQDAQALRGEPHLHLHGLREQIVVRCEVGCLAVRDDSRYVGRIHDDRGLSGPVKLCMCGEVQLHY